MNDLIIAAMKVARAQKDNGDKQAIIDVVDALGNIMGELDEAKAKVMNHADLITNNNALKKRVDDLANKSEKLLQEAEIHAQEARTQRATVQDIYQACGSNAGDWNGAKPVISFISDLQRTIEHLEDQLSKDE